ncbi:hypothetical protein CAY53_01875 [Desulfobulbus oralis]|uniref:Tc1-like transposase DDE domain-containing protein n=2 Tax=Desulfobulbus oralis TaxID=1986146 RepID=A0A2L1GL37_9BACT|nr:hypothetical protein CAY53_01875 [Desulfobulbus oralis]
MSDAYVWSMRAPALRPGDVVIMDNLSVHKSQAACDAIKARHAEYLLLPAYSPDLGPSEKMWSKVQQLLRGITAGTNEDLVTGTGKALDHVAANDAQGWFRSCGCIQS